MGGCCREIGAAIAASREHHRLGTEAVNRAIIHAQRDHTDAFGTVHDQVDGEIFDEEIGVVFQALLVECVEHGVAGAVCCGAGALDRRPLAHILHVATEWALIDRAVGIAAERHPGVLQFVNRCRGFSHHIFDGILIAQPV
jgi:hypothetical protein